MAPKRRRQADRKEGPTLQRAQDGLRSQCRRPKGSGKTGQHDRLSADFLV